MSAANIIVQSDSVHMLTDAATYTVDGRLHAIREKAVVIPSMHCAITTLGPMNAQQFIIGDLQAGDFQSFDELVDRGGEAMRDSFEANHDRLSSIGHFATMVYIVGWSSRRDRPECHSAMLADREEVERRFTGQTEGKGLFVLEPLTGLVTCPIPPVEQILAAGLPLPTAVAVTEDLDPAEALLRIIEMQRGMRCTDAKVHLVGGFALLTSVDRHGVSQRKIKVWDEDKVGELITPKTIAPVNLSRVRQQMLERKARKASRRAA